MSVCLATRIVNSERSIQDSDFSLKAQQVMQTAMKLPPHILPTLDELDPKSNLIRDKNVGVYVPGKAKPVGIYVPKNAEKDKYLPKKRPQPVNNVMHRLKTTPRQKILTPTRFKRKTPLVEKRPQSVENPMFKVHLRPGSPLGKLYDLTKMRSEKLLKDLSRIKLKKLPTKNR